MMTLPRASNGRTTKACDTATSTAQGAGALGGARVCERGAAGAVGAMGRCTRLAFAAVVALVLLGEQTSARSSLPHDTSCAGGRSRQHHHHQQPQQAWQFFSPSPKGMPSKASQRTSPLQPNKASPESRRRARVQIGSTVAGSAVSPAQMYRVSRSRGQGQGQRVLSFDAEDAARDSLQSPRSAERLTVYSTAPTASSTIAEGLGEVVQGQEGERPALPALSEEDLTQLRAGQRVQKQTRDGGAGSGSVVVDVRADTDIVMELLTKYEDYAEMIDTVRQCEVFPEDEEDKRKVEVTVSRFRLHIRVVMSLLRARNMVQFELDPDCTKAGRAVLREATGFFYVESPPDRPGYSRVWMLAKVDVNRFVPGGIVDYAAGRALPRASNWIKPTCEAAQRRKLRALGKGVSTA